MRKKILTMIVFAMLLSLTTACSKGTSPQEKQIWKVSLTGSDAGWKVFKEELEKRVGDQIEVRIYKGGAVASGIDSNVYGLKLESFEFSDMCLNDLGEFTDAFLPIDTAYMFLDRDDAFALMDSEAGDAIISRYEEETGLKLLGVFDNSFRVTTNNEKSIYAPEDMEGMTIRPNLNYMEAFKEFGAKPIPISGGEVYSALQLGTINGQENTVGGVVGSKTSEVQSYMSLTDHVYTFRGIHTSQSFYDKQSEEVRQAMQEAADIAVEQQRKGALEGSEGALEAVKGMGTITVNELTMEEKLAFRERVLPLWKTNSDKVGMEYFQMVRDKIDDLEK